jgi:hypothetical protein
VSLIIRFCLIIAVPYDSLEILATHFSLLFAPYSSIVPILVYAWWASQPGQLNSEYDMLILVKLRYTTAESDDKAGIVQLLHPASLLPHED